MSEQRGWVELACYLSLLRLKGYQVARRCKMDQSYFSRLYTGKRQPSDLEVEQVAAALGIDAKYLRPGALHLPVGSERYARAAS